MATDEERESVLSAVREELMSLTAINSSELARVDDLSRTLNFSEAVPHFERLLEACRQLHERDLSRLPHPQLEQILESCRRISELVKSVREFDLNQNSPADVCKNIIGNVERSYDQIVEPLLLPLAFTVTQGVDYAKREREAIGFHTKMEAEAEKLTKYLKSVQGEAASALEAVQEQAAQAGVSTNAQIFATESTTHEKLAVRWLVATIVMTAATFAAAIGAFTIALYGYHPETSFAMSQYLIAQLLVISTLSVTTVWCARNYRSHKHNATLNRHRANALMTFRAFVEGTSDERVKDGVLMQAAQAAFAGRPTGFDSTEPDNRTGIPIIEMLGRSVQQPD